MSTAEESISSLFNARINRMQWLLDYKTEAGIRTALERLNRRSRYGVDIDSAMQNLNEHRQEIEVDFQSFFPDIIAFTDKKIRALS